MWNPSIKEAQKQQQRVELSIISDNTRLSCQLAKHDVGAICGANAFFLVKEHGYNFEMSIL